VAEDERFSSALVSHLGRFDNFGRVSSKRERDPSSQLMNGKLLATVPADGRQHLENHSLVDLLGELLEDSLYRNQVPSVEKAIGEVEKSLERLPSRNHCLL